MRAWPPAALLLAVIACAAVPGACSAAAPSQATEQAAALPLTGRVVDAADILSAEAEATLTARLATLERETGVQFVVVSTPSLDDRDIADYATALGNAWGIGRKEQDDGLLLVVAPRERKVRIATGTGLAPHLTDAECTAIVEQMLPYYRKGDMQGGTLHGASALDQAVRLENLEPA